VRVTAKAEYACLALISLTHRQSENRPVHVREIAQAQGISPSILTQVLLKLKAAGMVRSARGSAGGYSLARPPESIPLGEVLRAIDGENGSQRELRGPSAYVLAAVWAQIRESERKVLEETSIAQLANNNIALDWVI
jgi:Rrf2 family transcriptional regulator, cysteine metabolism repressor